MTREDALHQVERFGNLSAARLLGSSNIPLPAMRINEDLCLKMWNVGRTQSLAKVELAPAEEPKLKKTAEEIALQKKKRQELQEQFEEQQNRNKEFQRKRSAAQKQEKDMKFDHTATEEFLLEQYNLAQQYLLAIKAQKAREAEEKEKQRLKTQKNDQLYNLQQEELIDRQKIETQYFSNPLLRGIHEEMVITLGIFKNAEALYEVVLNEKENAIKRITAQYDAFKDYYSELTRHWNFRFFFFQLSRLETAEGDLFHDIKTIALDFCVKNKINKHFFKLY